MNSHFIYFKNSNRRNEALTEGVRLRSCVNSQSPWNILQDLLRSTAYMLGTTALYWMIKMGT